MTRWGVTPESRWPLTGESRWNPPAFGGLLLEVGDYLLLEDGGRLLLDPSAGAERWDVDPIT